MSIGRVLSEYRWPIGVGALLSMSIVSSAVIVYVATRPDSPRPIRDYYQTARAWDADEAVIEASQQLGWTVQYDLPAGIPHVVGMPRPVDVRVVDREGKGVTGLTGQLFAIRPADTRRNQTGTLTELPQTAGAYRTLILLDEPGAWELRLDTKQAALRFVNAMRIDVPADAPAGAPAR